MGSGSGHAARATRPAQRKVLGTWAAQGAATSGVPFGKHVFLRPHRLRRTRITGAIKSIGRLVPVGSTRHRAYTPGLSTWSSSTALKGGLVLRGVSRLDAFSGYPVRT